MFELIELIKNSGKSVRSDFNRWFDWVPAAAAWNVISDYCLNDKNKQNDVFSFVIVFNHDTMSNISEYINAVAPRDLKATSRPSEGLASYLKCPVSFSLSFVVQRGCKFIRNYIAMEEIQNFLPQARELMNDWALDEPQNADYYRAVNQRLQQLLLKTKQKQRSERLFRQIFLVAALAAVVLDMIDQVKAPIKIRWISDRDAMFDQQNGVAFDLAWMFFQIMRRQRPGVVDLGRPIVSFATPGMDGKTEYAEFIRLPDFLAGTLADMKLPQMMFIHPKFPPIFNRIFVNSPNNTVIEILSDSERTTTRRICFGQPELAGLGGLKGFFSKEDIIF